MSRSPLTALPPKPRIDIDKYRYRAASSDEISKPDLPVQTRLRSLDMNSSYSGSPRSSRSASISSKSYDNITQSYEPHSWAAPEKSKTEIRYYAPKPAENSVPVTTHKAVHCAYPEVPTKLNHYKLKNLLALNDQFAILTTNTKTIVYSWRTTTVAWELKLHSLCAIFTKQTLWLGQNNGNIEVLNLLNGDRHTLECHIKPVTCLAETPLGIYSFSSYDGKVAVWNGYRVIDTHRVPGDTPFADMGHILIDSQTQSYFWTCRDHQVNLYSPESNFMAVNSYLLSRRGANLGAITAIATTGALAFIGQNDGFITVFYGNSRLCSLNGGIHAITALYAPSTSQLWVGTRSGEILIFQLSYVSVDQSINENGFTLEVNLTRQWQQQHPISQIKVASSGEAVFVIDKNGIVTAYNPTMADLTPKKEATSQKYNVSVFSWNCGACNPQSVNQQWLLEAVDNNTDIIVFGFQEVMELDNKSHHALNLIANGNIEFGGEYLAWQNYLEHLLTPLGFYTVSVKFMVGIMTCVFAKSSIYPQISGISSKLVKTGMAGTYGNKGGVITSCLINGMSFCFVNCHLAAGQSGIIQRNRDAKQILDGIRQPNDPEFDVCFFFGDTNYRVNTIRGRANDLIKAGNWEQLRTYDQLQSQIAKNPSFCLSKFEEGVLNFPPTYKFDVGTSRYDTSDKKRTQSWCDRILYRGQDITVGSYTSINTLSSDHKAVLGTYTVPHIA